jgi:hypothetical protein
LSAGLDKGKETIIIMISITPASGGAVRKPDTEKEKQR